ncbi:unnamed protein product [Colias eurytheme]|nr:unnamed protein product [Colias eurytheme]
MSRYLWGIVQILNEPSSDLLDIFKCRSNTQEAEKCVSNNQISGDANLKEDKSVQVVYFDSDEFHLDHDRRKKIEVQSKLVQVNRSRSKHRQVCSQFDNPLNDIANKNTSAINISIPECDIGTNTSFIRSKMNAETEPMHFQICPRHREVFKVLEKWPHVKMNIKKSAHPLENIWTKIKEHLSRLQIQKINSIPDYYQSDKHILILYKRVKVKS